jgi:hypothetical protein
MPEPISFHGVLAEAGGGGALVELPSAAIAALGDAKRVRVRGTLNGVAFASNTMPMGGGRLCLGVHKATRLAAGAAFGDEVAVTMRVDDAPRVVELPAELHEALAADPGARAVFDGLAFTHRREYATWVAEAKRPETRARRVAQTMERLRR